MRSSKGSKDHLLGQLHVCQEIVAHRRLVKHSIAVSLGGYSENVCSLYLTGQKVSPIYAHCTLFGQTIFNGGLILVGYKLSVKFKISVNVCCPLKIN